jgi:type IV secretory pathway component VirB8
MLHRVKTKGSTQLRHQEQNSVQKLHRHLAWALSVATVALIINAMVVVALVDEG